ncbi:MAG: 50S ribosomal protein L17, partial [Flavobacterium sp.]
MNHGNSINHLGRTASHRKALIANMASSLILHKKIKTTVAKAKMLRMYVEPLITRAKSDTTHSRRTVFSYLQNKEVVRTNLSGSLNSKEYSYQSKAPFVQLFASLILNLYLPAFKLLVSVLYGLLT